MKKMKFNRFAARSVTAGFVVAALMAAQGAVACTVENWKTDGAVTAGVEVGGPGQTVNIPRYSRLCSMRTPENPVQPEYVQNDSPGGLSRIRARFYVFASNNSDALVYQGFDANSSSVFSVTLDQSQPEVDFGALGTTISVPYNSGKWNSIEIDWNAGTGELELIVNGTSATTTPGASSETVDFVRMGNLTPVAEELLFDAYESRRTSAIGLVMRGDANADGNVDVGDITSVANEIFAEGNPLAPGQPDCNEDGDVNVGDITCLANDIF